MKINIIGAGISGLYTGYLLSKANIDFEIFEASDRSGGRINTWHYNNEHFVELGAEVVYAPKSLLIKTLKKLGDSIEPLNGENYYAYQQQLVKRQDVPIVERLIQDLYDLEDYTGEEMSLFAYFQQQEYYSSDLTNLVEAYACEYGTTAEKLGVKNLAMEESAWSGGDEEYFSLLPMQRVSDYYKNKVKDKIRYNKVIKHISYSGDNVQITDDQGNEYVSDKAIISVNLGILKAGDINFDPVLPNKKKQAIKNIGIDVGMKVILIFSEKWWPYDLLTIEGGKSCYEFLATKSYNLPTLTGFVMGDKVKIFQGMNDKQLRDLMCTELNNIFGHNKASETMTHVFSKNWGDDIYHKGAYSFPTPDSAGMRNILAEPVGDKLFFMGEACNINGHAATIHGAMETAETVFKNLVYK